MKNVKKIMGLALTLVLGLTAVGCSSTSSSSSSSASSEGKDSGVKEITMASTYSLDETGFLADTLKTFAENAETSFTTTANSLIFTTSSRVSPLIAYNNESVCAKVFFLSSSSSNK